MKRTISLLLALLLSASALFACAEDDGKKPAETTANSSVTTAAPETTPEETRLYADHLPDVKYDGETFKTAHWQYDTGIFFEDMDTEQDGDLVHDAVFKRNSTVEEKYGIEIVNEYVPLGTLTSNVKKMVQTGDQLYDSVFFRAYEIPGQYNNGVLLNLFALPHIDWTSPWWDQDSVSGLSICGVLPAVASDINLSDNIATACVMFNKDVATDHDIDSDEFYQYVLDGTWTIDKMYEISKPVSEDVDGDGEHDEDDVYGLMGQHDPTYMLFFGSGERYVENDSEGIPQLVFDNERSYAVCDKIISVMNDNVNYVNRDLLTDSSVVVKLFSENKCLFLIERLYRTEALRDMKSDYGVLPIPKYDEAQDRYYNIVSIHNSTLMAIPKTNNRIEFTAIILEALACESLYTVTDVYYDVVLQSKLTRDDASYKMIDIIFNNRVFDIGEVYKVGVFSEELLHMANENKNMTSTYKSFESKMQKDLKAIIKKAEKMLEEGEALEY